MTKSTLPTRGRPSILTTQMINRIAKAVQSGKTRDGQAAEVGVRVRTLYEWIALGRKIRDAGGGGASTGRDLMALRLVLAIESAERKAAVCLRDHQ
ncbi:hypothetical protein [Streptomyces flaveolus]|uniref:hypothetical protein n=1 Tax=Streptomyces flaveolus TaxID=67297 RepID=UPI00343E5707